MTGCSGSRPRGAVNLATTEPLQRERLGDRGQMVAMVFEPNFKACNASFMVEMSLLLAANTFTLLLSKDITSHTKRGGDMCGERKGGKKNVAEAPFVCRSADPWVHHSSLLLAHLTSFFWCCFVAMVTKCYSMRRGTVCTEQLSAYSSTLMSKTTSCDWADFRKRKPFRAAATLTTNNYCIYICFCHVYLKAERAPAIWELL